MSSTVLTDPADDVTLKEGEYFIHHDDVTYYDDIGPCPTKIHAHLRADEPSVYTLRGIIGEGGLGAVFEYRSDDGKSVALKMTEVQTQSDVGPSKSHHLTESRGPHRLRFDGELAACGDFFIETLVPHETSVNCAVTNDVGDSGYTIGKENPIALWEKSQWRSSASIGPKRPERLNVFESVTVDMRLFTVMRKAKNALFEERIGYRGVEKILSFLKEARACLSDGYYYKDIKLDQILVMDDGSLKLGDLGNVCRLDDDCTFGYFDDPELWKWETYLPWRRARWVEKDRTYAQDYMDNVLFPDIKLSTFERTRALRWQETMFTCELVCATELLRFMERI